MSTTDGSRTAAVDERDGAGDAALAALDDDTIADLAHAGQRRRWPLVLAALVVGLATGVAAAALTDGDGTDEQVDEVGAELRTVEVTRTDLVTTSELEGTLRSGDPLPVPAPTAGIVVTAATEGQVLDAGDVIVTVDDLPVVVLHGDLPLWRRLADGVDEGPDVEVLEANLVALGFDPDGTVTVDEDFTSYTAAMVERWQESLGVEETGRVEPSGVVVVPGQVRVDEIAAPGSTITTGASLASTTLLAERTWVIEPRLDGALGDASSVLAVDDRTRSIEVIVDAADADELVIGTEAAVELPGGDTASATLTDVADAAETTADGLATVASTWTLEPAAEPTIVDGPVTLTVIDTAAPGAVVVPARALVALREGGFAVEVPDVSGTMRLVGVETGLFLDGLVEITAGDLVPGDQVAVPA